MKIYKKIFSTAMTIAAVSGCIVPVSAAQEEIIQGKDIYETAGMIADRQSYDTAILVNLENYIADGLSASGLAGASNAVILPVKKDSIPTETLDRVKNLKKVYIIGEELAISNSVESKLKGMGISVERLGGKNRYETSYTVAKEISEIKDVTSVALTNGYNGEPDSISIASVAARDGMPVILTNGKNVPFSTSGVKTYAIGGTSVISESLISSTNAERLGGKNRYETNTKIINKFYSGVKNFYVADGFDLTNGLIGCTISKNAPLVLVSKGSDKSILSGAQKIGKIGNLSTSIYEECLRQDGADSVTTSTESFNILSAPTSTYEQCVKWAENKNASDLFMEILPILYNTAVENGVDPTLVVAQCAKETGYCKFGGVLDASFKNTCGLKTPSGGGDYDQNAHTRFDSWEDGALAQVQHLALYAGKEGYPLSNPKDPRHFASLFGKCKTVKSLSNNWAGANYGEDLERMMNEIINTK